ncbi:MAG: zinc ribbon domain-containing protein, partial [Thermoplasmata archaeon]|nr:zinc ribbon domain-containing protein [Thermoplasmata archaeon]
LSKNLAKIGMNSITGFFIAPATFFDDSENHILSGLLEQLPAQPLEILPDDDVLDLPGKRPEHKYDRVISKVLDNLGISKDDLGDDFNEFGIWLCFECGAFVDQDAKECPTCHSPVELVIHTDEKIMNIEELVSKCPECGVPTHVESEMCGVCGRIFSGEDKEDMLGQGIMSVVEDVSEDDIGFVVCPDCGSFVNKTKESCGLCGAKIDLETAQEIGSEEQVANELAGLLVTELEFDDELEAAFEERSFIMCPECSASVDSSKENCAICGTNLTGVEGHIPDIGKAALATVEKTKAPPAAEDGPSAADKYWYKDESELYLCPSCGSFISSDAESCEVCGVVFDTEVEEIEPEPAVETMLCPECQTVVPISSTSCPKCGEIIQEEKEDGYWIKEQKGLFMCPMCGSFLPDGADSCGSCGVEFEGEDEGEESDEPRERACPECGATITPDEEKCGICGHDIEVDGFWFKKQKGLFMCPSCGTFLAEDVERCHSCGIAFEAGEEEIVEPEANICPNCQADLTPGQGACSICGFDFSAGKDEGQDGFWYKESDELFMCPGCGAFISSSSTGCINCGMKFDDEEVHETPDIDGLVFMEEPDVQEEPEESLYLCPECGFLISASAETCHNCGMSFVDDEISYDPDKEIEELNQMLVLDEPTEEIILPDEAAVADAGEEIQELSDMLITLDDESELPSEIDEELDALDLEIDEITDMLVLDEVAREELSHEDLDHGAPELDKLELLEVEE